MPKILGLDPGVTTGFAIIEYQDDSEPKLIDHGQIPNGHLGFIDHWFKFKSYDLIVCESFTLREGIKGVTIEPAYVIGALEALNLDETEIIYQQPSFKTLCDNDALKNLEMYVRGQQHARDAIRHPIAYLKTKIKHTHTLKKGWPE